MDIATKLYDHVHETPRHWKLFGHPELQFYGKKSTWTALFKVLRELDLQEWSKQVEEFLTRMFGSWLHVGLGIPQQNKITSHSHMRVHGVQSSGFRAHHLTTATAVVSPLKEHLIIRVNKQAPIERWPNCVFSRTHKVAAREVAVIER